MKAAATCLYLPLELPVVFLGPAAGPVLRRELDRRKAPALARGELFHLAVQTAVAAGVDTTIQHVASDHTTRGLGGDHSVAARRYLNDGSCPTDSANAKKRSLQSGHCKAATHTSPGHEVTSTEGL